MKILIMTAALVIGSSAGVAATGKSEGSSKDKAAQSTLYCLAVEGTGSRLATKLCMTEDQWRAEGVSVTRK